MPLMKCNRGSSFLINGPAFIALHDGESFLLGKRIVAGEEMIVPKGKSAPLEVESESIIEIRLGSGASINEFVGAIPNDWKTAVETILNSKAPLKVMIIGGVDSGKTTFAVYSSNMGFDRGLEVAVVDADPGQGEISPPTTIGLGILKSGIISLNNIPSEDMRFVGSTTPSDLDSQMRIIIGARALVDKAFAKGANLVIINTCGWVSGRRARDFKMSLIQSIAPDFLVIIQKESELAPLITVLDRLKFIKTLKISTSPASRVRSREERKSRREDAYQRYFAKSKTRVFNLIETPLLNGHYTYGRTMPSTLLEDIQKQLRLRLLYGELGDDFLFLVTEREADPTEINKLREITGMNDIIIMPKGFEKGIMLGLISPDGGFAGLGIISHIDYESKKMIALTPIDCEVATLVIGHLKLDDSWHEVCRLTQAPL